MHRPALALLLCLFSSLAIASYAFPPQNDNVQKYFKIACKYSQCQDLKAPLVVFMDTGFPLGYYYFGTSTVFITQECLSRIADDTKCAAILIHEMTHYILDAVWGIAENCRSEGLAWKVYNKYVVDAGRPDLVNENWVEAYPSCQEKSQ